MLVVIRGRLQFKRLSEEPPTGYPIRSSSFVASTAAHCAGIALLGLVSFNARPPERPVFDELIQPHAHQIVFYHFPAKTPEVAPLKKIGHDPRPHGAELSKQTIIATSPRAQSKQEFIWQPAPQIEIHEDLPAPLLVARLETSLPPPPAPPKPRTFVPPPPRKAEPKLPMQTPVPDTPAPPIDAAVKTPLPIESTLTFSNLAAPPPKAPLAPTAAPGNDKADIAIASLHPAKTMDRSLPNGERPGEFSKAPEAGPAASGDIGNRAALTVPGLSIRQSPKNSPDTTNWKPILYADRVRSVPASTLSVPLRPASRMIPRSVDARFQGRSVYTMVVPIENLPTYLGDWILWFADRESKPGETPVVRAPVPFRKLEPANWPSSGGQKESRIQIAAFLEKDGSLHDIAILTATDGAIQRAVAQDMKSWQFKPATRNGVPVDVDVVFEIPFNVPVVLAWAAP